MLRYGILQIMADRLTCETASAEELEIMRAKREFRLKVAEVDTEERKYLAGVARRAYEVLAAAEDGLRGMGALQVAGPALAGRDEALVQMRRAIKEQNVLITSLIVAMELGVGRARNVFDRTEMYDYAGLSEEQSKALKKAREEKEKEDKERIKGEQQHSQQLWGFSSGRGGGRGRLRNQPYYY